MITVNLFIVIDIQEDSEGYVCPVYFTREEAEENYPNSEILTVEMTNLDINLN